MPELVPDGECSIPVSIGHLVQRVIREIDQLLLYSWYAGDHGGQLCHVVHVQLEQCFLCASMGDSTTCVASSKRPVAHPAKSPYGVQRVHMRNRYLNNADTSLFASFSSVKAAFLPLQQFPVQLGRAT